MLHYDDSAHPFVRMTITGQRSAEDRTAWMTRMAALLDAGAPFVLVVDDRSTTHRPTGWGSLRSLWWAAGQWERLERTCVGVAIVVAEPRLIATPRAARRLLPPLPVPVSVLDDTRMAEAWARGRLGASGGRAFVPERPPATVAWRHVPSADADV